MEGCISCVGYEHCVQCNNTEHYYLANGICQLNRNPAEYIFTQSQTGLVMELRPSELTYGEYLLTST